MAKRKIDELSTPARETRSSARAAVRATRSATRRGAANLTPPVDNPQPRRTKKARIDGASPSSAAAVASSSAAPADRKTRSAARNPPVAPMARIDDASPSSAAAVASPSATISARKTRRATLTPPVDQKARIDGASPSSAAAAASSPAAPAARKTRSAALTSSVDPKAGIDGASPVAAAVAGESSAGRKTVIIEHCSENEAFKMKAEQVKEGLEKSISGVRVVLNPGTARKGCFEIRMENGIQIFESLLDDEAVKALDVQKLVSDIVPKIQ